jgi:hypothetical protein
MNSSVFTMPKELISFCSRCEKVKIIDEKLGEIWIGKEHPYYKIQLENHDPNYGYCPECVQIVIRDWRAFKESIGVKRLFE